MILIDLSWASISFNIFSGIYSTVARVYDILLQIINNDSNLSSAAYPSFSTFATSIYVLAGVFMLFRTVLSLVQMLINPDQMTDKNAGAGKVVVRIVVSIVMLILFVPGGLIIGQGKLLEQLQSAIVGTPDPKTGKTTDGLIPNIFDSKNAQTNSSAERLKKVFYEEVDAAGTSMTCYYYDNVELKKNMLQNHNSITIGSFYKITFSTEKKEGYTAMLGHGNDQGVPVYYKVGSGAIDKDKYGSDFKYKSLPGGKQLYDMNSLFYSSDGVWKWSNKKATLPSSCPKYLDTSSTSIGVYEKEPNSTTGLVGGYSNVDDMIKTIEKRYKDYEVTSEDNPAVDSHKNGKTLLPNLRNRDDAIGFTQSVASSFINCIEDDDSSDSSSNEEKNTCDTLQKGLFLTKEGNDNFVNAMRGDTVSIDFLTSLLAGVGIIAYLLILCVDVIVRDLKLMLLEFLAPIPIISYIDPKDKIFAQWGKMFLSVYVDLFIKIIGIKIATIYLSNISNFSSIDRNPLVTFFYIVGVLVFAKLVPTMISKIFGLDSMGSSFKDIAGMAKKAAGVGTAATLAGATGIATGAAAFAATKGQGFGNRLLAGMQGLGSGMSGVVKGAAAGAKGNVFGAAKQVGSANLDRRAKYNSGLTPTNLLEASTLGKVGMARAQRTDRKLEPLQQESSRLSDVNGVKDKISEVATKSDFGKYVDNLASQNHIDPNQAKKWKDKWIDAQIAGYNGDSASVDAFRKEVENDSIISGYTGDIIEGGKQAQIRQQMTKINDMIKGDPTISKVIGNKPITSYGGPGGVKAADEKANKRKEEIFDVVTEATESGEYRSSKAAIGGNSGGENN